MNTFTINCFFIKSVNSYQLYNVKYVIQRDLKYMYTAICYDSAIIIFMSLKGLGS